VGGRALEKRAGCCVRVGDDGWCGEKGGNSVLVVEEKKGCILLSRGGGEKGTGSVFKKDAWPHQFGGLIEGLPAGT